MIKALICICSIASLSYKYSKFNIEMLQILMDSRHQIYIGIFASVLLLPINAQAVSASWLSSPGSADYNTGTNWSGGVVPGGTIGSTDVATFGTSSTKTITFTAAPQIGAWNLTDTGYNFNLGTGIDAEFYGGGIIANGNSPTVTVGSGSTVGLNNSASCAGVSFSVSGGTVTFNNTSTGDSSTIITFTTASTLNVNSATTLGAVVAGGGASASVINVASNFTMGNSSSFTYNGTLSGSGTITKTGTGTLTYPNTSGSGINYIISQGSISIGGGGSTGSIAGSIQNNSNLIFNRSAGYTHTGVISGTGTVTFNSSGNTTLTGANSYQGGSTIIRGTVSIGNNTALGSGNVTIAGNCTISSSGQVTVANNIALGSGFNITMQGNNNYTLSGILSGSSTVTKNGISTLTLSGNNINTGTITVSNGTLQGTTSSIVVPIVNNSSVIFNQSTNGVYAQNISGSGNLSINGTGVVSLSGTHTFTGGTTLNAGTLSVTGQLGGAVTINSGATLKGTGVVTGNVTSSGGVVAPGTSIGTLNINGALNLGSASTTQIELSPSASSKLVMGGAANIDGTLNLVFDAGSYSATGYTILSATSVNGTFNAITASGVPSNINYSLQYSGNSVVLNLAVGSNLSQRATSSLGQTIGSFLDAVSAGNPTTEQSNLINAINSITNSNAFDLALGQVQPFANSIFLGKNISVSNNSMVSIRLANLRNEEYYFAGDVNCKDGLWIRPFYESGKQGNYKNLLGYRDNISGIVLGLDHAFKRATFGLGLSYSYSVVKSINYYNTSTNVKTYLCILYGSYDFTKSVFMDYIFTGGKNSYAGTRNIIVGAVNNTALSKYNGQQYSAELILGKKHKYKRSYITPMLTADYVYLQQDAYSENGAGSLGMSVQDSNTSVVSLGAGFEVGSLQEIRNTIITPELHILGYYDAKPGNANISSSFVTGGPVLSTSAVPGRLTGVIGATAKFMLSHNLECELGYDFQGKAQYVNNIAYMNFRYTF